MVIVNRGIMMKKLIRRCWLCKSLPDTPPYVVSLFFPTLGQGVPSALSPIIPETVLVAVTPLAPPMRRHNIIVRINHKHALSNWNHLHNAMLNDAAQHSSRTVTEHRKDSELAERVTFVGSLGNLSDAGNVWCQFGKERNGNGCAHPATDVTH